MHTWPARRSAEKWPGSTVSPPVGGESVAKVFVTTEEDDALTRTVVGHGMIIKTRGDRRGRVTKGPVIPVPFPGVGGRLCEVDNTTEEHDASASTVIGHCVPSRRRRAGGGGGHLRPGRAVPFPRVTPRVDAVAAAEDHDAAAGRVVRHLV